MGIRFKLFSFKWIITVVFFIPQLGNTQTRPKLVVGIVVDQMRWDYLYRYQNRWHKDGGIRRMLDHGFSCEKTYLNYLPTYTACGHTSIYTGSVPAIHGITGNQWWDQKEQRFVYCTGDTSVRSVGGTTDAGQMSPVNLLANSICDELQLSTNFRSKTIGIALKDRGAILPAGRSASAAYWYDTDQGEWITSSYYMKELPAWVKNFKTKKMVDSLYLLDWKMLYPPSTYLQSVAVKKTYELRSFGASTRQFPYDLKKYAEANYNVIETLPQGNTLTTEFAKAAVIGETMGKDSITDFLAVSYSSTDIIGHAFGPNSVEMEDALLRFDIELGSFFDFLDKQVGKGEYLVFLTSDHGAAQVPGFLAENKMSGGIINEGGLVTKLNEALKKEFMEENLCLRIVNLQVVLNMPAIERKRKSKESDIIGYAIKWLETQEGISRAFRLDALAQTALPATWKTQVENGYYPARSGHIQLVYQPGYIDGFLNGGTTHGSGYAYDTHVPLLWYGWQIPEKKMSVRTITITDIAPTIAAMLHIQEPNGCVGNVIEELFENINSLNGIKR
jgi:predicted AlkP superfamily pyrophosphatase or phosphodiesterase